MHFSYCHKLDELYGMYYWPYVWQYFEILKYFFLFYVVSSYIGLCVQIQNAAESSNDYK